MTHSYYVIADVDNEVPAKPNSNSWPKLIGFSFENMNVLIQVGRGHGLIGASVVVSKLNISDWLDVFQDTGSDWFKDMIVNGDLSQANAENNLAATLKAKGVIKTIDY